jgi:Domain of unknown function (DUF5060)/Protein of unknown function (DUF4038)/Domain of unknown function (DUF5605)
MKEINRREMLKISSGALAAFASAGSNVAAAVLEPAQNTVPKWEIFELTLQGPSTGNPFTEVELTATFVAGSRAVKVDGFYDGAGRYKIRFMPDEEGRWDYSTQSGAPDLHGKTGTFTCVRAAAGVHGPVRVRNTHHFAYADGTPYFPFGTTCYAWIHQGDALERLTLKTLSTAPFNKIRMCVFPKSYEYNHNEPVFYPFDRSADGNSDFSRPNPAFFAHLEERIVELGRLGIEADLILFHPYDRWGYATMSQEADDRYLRYVLARLSAYRNIWWSLANEFDLMKAKSAADFDRFFHLVEQHDPVGHLRSVHYSKTMYDYSRPWVTHASLQTYDFEAAAGWLKAWSKPIVYDEVMYEGNLDRRWGNISGEEMTRRFWLGVIAGCYVTHGETYLDPEQPLDENTTPTLWWSHGGTLHGTSPARIAFLRRLVEQTATAAGAGSTRTGLEAGAAPYYLNASSVDAAGRIAEVLYYMDFHQPIYYQFPLPEGSFRAEQIDPWQMTVTPLSPTPLSGKAKLKLTGKPNQALRFRRTT